MPSRTRCASARASEAICRRPFRSASKIVGHDQRVLRGDRDAHVDPRIQLQPPVAIGAVRPRVLAKRDRARLDDHVVERRHRLALLRRRLDPCSRRHRPRHVDLRREIEVRRGGLRLGHPPGDGLLELRQVLGGPPFPWPSPGARAAPGVGSGGRRRRGAAAGAAGAGPAAIARSTSALTIRPPGPEPESAARSSPFSLAIRRARGEALTLPSPVAAAGRGRRGRRDGGARLVAPPQRASDGAGSAAASGLRAFAAAPSPDGCSPARPPARSPGRSAACPPRGRGSRSGSRRRVPRRPCWPCRSRSRPVPRRARPGRRPTSATAGSCPPPSSRRAAA